MREGFTFPFIHKLSTDFTDLWLCVRFLVDNLLISQPFWSLTMRFLLAFSMLIALAGSLAVIIAAGLGFLTLMQALLALSAFLLIGWSSAVGLDREAQ
jgi:hypothetical protein